jgi:hypothetical protein
MESQLVWFLNIVLSDDFVLMFTMFILVGAAEYFFPARHIPRGHYVLNLSFAFVNVFAVWECKTTHKEMSNQEAAFSAVVPFGCFWWRQQYSKDHGPTCSDYRKP